MKNDLIATRPAISIACAFILGMIFAQSNISFLFVVLFSAAIFIAFLIFSIRYKKSLFYVLLPIALCVGSGLFYMSFHPIISANSIYFKTHLQEKIVLVGEIERFELKKKDSSQAVVIAEKIVFPDGKEEKSEGRVLLNIKGACTVFFRPGTQVSVPVTLEAFSSFKTPGVFDVATYMKQQGIYARASVPCEEIAITATQKISWIQDRIIQIREIISFHIDQMVPDKDANSVLKALLIGDRHEISLEVQESFSRTGTAHLLAISGLHVGLVMALFFFLFRSILYFSNRLTQTGNARKVAALLTILPVLAYGLIAGMSPSTQRAVIMCLLFLVSLLFQRKTDGLNTLAIAAICILLVFPPAILSISFQLSFISVAFILLGKPLITLPKISNGVFYNTGIRKIGSFFLGFVTCQCSDSAFNHVLFSSGFLDCPDF